MKVDGDDIELHRRSGGFKRYKLQDCSWFIATPRHDSGIAAAWSLVVPNPNVIIIEFPERTWTLFGRYPNERAAVGWTDETWESWRQLLESADIPERRGSSQQIKYFGPFG